jgi:hypothetical protein
MRTSDYIILGFAVLTIIGASVALFQYAMVALYTIGG